jgi:geranylgeranyl pyrophosphate synthase
LSRRPAATFGQGLPLAAAAECLIAASDVLDDVEDDDSPSGLDRACGRPTAINVGVFLAFLAQVALHRLAGLGIDEQTIRACCRVFASAGAVACCGQQRDIDQADELLTEDGYLEMVRAKSGALVAGLGRAAALVADARPATTEAYARFGDNLGMALQVSNDVRAVSANAGHRNDLLVGKRTLPLIFALQQAPAAAQRLVSVARGGRLRPAQAERLGELLNTSGGVLYASVVADAFFEDALVSLDEAGCPRTAHLRAYVSALRHD